MGLTMNFRIITKNHAADSKIGPQKKSILEPLRIMSIPTVWELLMFCQSQLSQLVRNFDLNSPYMNEH